MSTITLLQIPEIKKQPAHRKTYALHLINRGADAALLLFWINLITFAYSHLGTEQVRKDVIAYIERYSEFAEDIIQWYATFEKHSTEPKQTKPLCGTSFRTPSLPRFAPNTNLN